MSFIPPLCSPARATRCDKGPQSGWAEATEIYFSLSWRLKVQDQGVCRVGFSRGLSHACVDGRCLPVPLLVTPLCRSVSRSPPLLGPGPTAITSLYTNYFFKGPTSQCSHILRGWG